MKAIVIDRFGDAGVLQVREVTKPVAAHNEVTIKVAYTAVNPVDWKIRKGYLKDAFPHRFPLIPGWDLAGTIEAVGDSRSRFKVGDRVYAYARKPEVQHGTYAEYVSVAESSVALAPRTLSLEQAATIPLVGLTAWQALHGYGRIAKGMTVLIHAGAGGVGSFAIQFAKAAGARVLSTSSRKNHEYLAQLGVDRAIDYQTELFEKVVRNETPEGVDLVFDTVGGEVLERSYGVLRTGGALVGIVDEPEEQKAGSLGIRAGYVFVEPSSSELDQIAQLADAGILKTPEFQVMPLERAGAAHDLSETGHVRGKILLKP